MASKDYAFRYYETFHRASLLGHNHKELSAWAGLILELAYCAGVLQVAGARDASVLVLAISTASIGLVTFFVWRYIHNQLEQKDLHGAYFAAASLFLAEIAAHEGDTVDDKYLALQPNFDTEFQSNRSRPHHYQRKMKYMNIWGKGRAITRQMIFGLLAVSSGGTVTLLWLLGLGSQ